MKIKFVGKKDKEKDLRDNNGFKSHKHIRTEPLKKVYETPKVFLRKSMELIYMSVQEQLRTIFADYQEWRRGKAKRPEYIFNMIQDIAFVSILPKIVKKNGDVIEEYGEEFSEIIAAAVAELSKNKVAKGKEMISIYSKLYEDLNESRIKKIFKMDLNGVDWDTALKISICSHGSPRHTMGNTLRLIYSSVKCREYDKLHKLLRKLYGKSELDKVAVYILLERAYDKQKCAWMDREQYSVLTNIALDEINQHTKDEIKELLKLYCAERRRSEHDEFQKRRVNFAAISKDDYGKIGDVVKKLAEKNIMYRVFLDQTQVERMPKK